MQIHFKYKGVSGFGRWYAYGYKHTHMITKQAKERLRILEFWRDFGLKATRSAFKARRSTLYGWRQIYLASGKKLESLNLGSQAPFHRRKRIVDYRLIQEIKRLRIEVCPNMGKDKIKVFLDPFCQKLGLEVLSVSKIGRIIKDRRIYHQRQKFYHNGKIKAISRRKKKRKPDNFRPCSPGDLVEMDTIVRFDWGVKRYIVTAVDAKTRYAFSWNYQRANSQSVKDFFQKFKLVFPHQIKHLQTDNGSEFHKYFADYLKEQKTIHFWNYPGKPYRNGLVEKYNRTIQEEFIDQNSVLLEQTDEFNRKLMDWLIWYNTRRPHWSLGLISPVDYMVKNNLLSRMLWTDTNN